MGKHNFEEYKIKLSKNRVPLTERSYYKYGSWQSRAVANNFSLEDIEAIIREGDISALRELSRYYYRTNSIYKNNIDFLANLFLYDWGIIPIFKEGEGSQTQIMKAFYKACAFIDALDLPTCLSHITTEWLISGIYNGILRETGDKVAIQDLPLGYCRSRFKDFNNLNILEFNLRYFDTIRDEEYRREAIATFPPSVRRAYAEWSRNNFGTDPWVMIPPEEGGISFSFINDPIPALIGSIPDLKKLEDAVKREGKRDENELYKILIQEMPIDSNGQLVFELDEVADIHASVAEMLADTDTVEVLTTFGQTKMENLQQSSAASQAADRIAKYKTNAWDSVGRGEILFNATNSSSLAYSIKKDETIMKPYIDIYETLLKYVINQRFARRGLTFGFQIFPTTIFNRSDIQQSYFRGAQYGYSKMFAGVVMGLSQLEQISLMTFENDFLQMSNKMIPLQSSYTTSGNVIADEEKTSSSVKKTTTTQKVQDITNTGGRPELPDEQKSEKTQANIESLG